MLHAKNIINVTLSEAFRASRIPKVAKAQFIEQAKFAKCENVKCAQVCVLFSTFEYLMTVLQLISITDRVCSS